MGGNLFVAHGWVFELSRGLYVGGSWGNGTNSGRWASNWNNTPTTTGNNIGLRCAVPLSLDPSARVLELKTQGAR